MVPEAKLSLKISLASTCAKEQVNARLAKIFFFFAAGRARRRQTHVCFGIHHGWWSLWKVGDAHALISPSIQLLRHPNVSMLTQFSVDGLFLLGGLSRISAEP
jgi:hypothetical protein